MGLGVAAAGAEDTTGAAGIWPRTVAHDQQLINFSNFTIHLTFVTSMSCCVFSRMENFVKKKKKNLVIVVKLICGSIKPAI